MSSVIIHTPDEVRIYSPRSPCEIGFATISQGERGKPRPFSRGNHAVVQYGEIKLSKSDFDRKNEKVKFKQMIYGKEF